MLSASLLAGLLAAEAGLRLFGVSYPEFHRLDDQRGWAPRPGVAGWWTVEGNAYISNNREGFRDRDHAVAKPPGTFRIAVLGDSLTEARAIPIDDTFWSIAGRRLADCPGLSGAEVEVLSFGVNGYGAAQELITLRRHVLKYRPDLVLLAFFSESDVWNNSRALDGHADRPYFVLDDGELTLDGSFRRSIRFQAKMTWQDVKHGLVNASRVLQLAKESYYRVKSYAKNRGANFEVAFFAPGAPDALYLPPADALWRDAWAVTEAILRAMRDDAAAQSAAFWIVTLSNAIQVHPNAVVRERFRGALGADTLFYPDDRIRAFAEREGIPAVILAPRLRAYAETNGVFLHGFGNTSYGYGHWNRSAHAAAGALIADAICPPAG